MAEDWFESRGFSPETVKEFRLGVVENPLPDHERYEGKLCIPYLDRAGRVLKVRFRCLEDHGVLLLKELIGFGQRDLDFLEALYHASPDVMLKLLGKATGDTVMMVGHNPGIAEFAAMLVARPPSHPDFGRYPTAATLVVDFQIDSWKDLKPGTGSVLDFFIPSGRD